MLTCPACGRDNPEGSRFCNACGTVLAEPEPAGREYRKVVTVLFCDVVGSTALGESTDPEALRALLGRYFDQMKAIVERHGGTVEKFIGDAVMAVFGVPRLHEDDALRAVRAAVEMRDALPELGIHARIGLNTGEVVVGTAERLATGDAVNVAARLEQAAGVGEILLGPETASLVRDAVETEELTLELKGKSEPLVAHRLLALHEEAPAFARHLDAPLVGRERELHRLQETFAQAVADRSCQLFTILGTAGVGKSRLTAELIGSLGGATVVRGRCLPYGEGITYWPVIEILEQLPPPAELGLEPSAVRVLENLLGETLAVGAGEEIPWAVRKALEAAAQEAPVVAVFDDIHWGETTFLDLLEHIADLSREAPLLLLCLARPELLDRRPGWGGGKLNATTQLLEPLSQTETDELLERLLAGAALEPGLRQRIRDAAEGNPLFVEEMVALVEESGDGEISVPATIQALLAARLDQLEPAERGVLERGAVEGRIFHRGAVAALAPDEPNVDGRLTGLVRKELVRPDKAQFAGDDAYRFRHLLIRDAAYEALPKSTRAELHERFADWLQAHAGELVELDEILGYHLEQAYRYRAELGAEDGLEALGQRAASSLAAAGRKAQAVDDVAATVSLLQRAVRLAEPAGADGIDLLVDLAKGLRDAGGFEESTERFEEARELARAIGDRALELRASCEVMAMQVVNSSSLDSDEALEFGREAVGELESLGDDRALASAWSLILSVENLHGNWSGVLPALEHSLEHARRADDRTLERDMLRSIGPTLFWGPTPLAVGLPRAKEVLESVRDEKSVEAFAKRSVAGFYGLQGRFDEARELLAESRASLEELGRTVDVETLAFWTGPLELIAGEPAAAERVLSEACDWLEAAGEKNWFSTLAGFLAQALYDQGRLEEAEAAALRSREAAAPSDPDAQSHWRAVLAQVLARRGEFDEAERLAREAVESMDCTDQLGQQALMRLRLAETLELAGRRDDAAAAFAEALEQFERKGNEVMASRVRERLAALSAA